MLKNVQRFWKNFPRFWENVQRFLENVRCFYWMLGEEWIALPRTILSAPDFRLLHLSRACAWARTPCIFALFAFTTFIKTDVVYWKTAKCEGIRNGVLQKSTKVRLVEAMKGVVFWGEIVWFASHFYENSTPIGEGCESKKCMFAGNARAYTRKLTLYFFHLEWVACTGEGSSAFLIISSLWMLLFSMFIVVYCKV